MGWQCCVREIHKVMFHVREIHKVMFHPQVKVTKELLKLQTYERLFQRLVSTQKLVPLGIYRTVPTTVCTEIHSSSTHHEERKRAASFLQSRLQNLGLKHERKKTSIQYYFLK